MKSKDDLRQWVLSRAISHDDAVIGSKLVARYVAEVVRADRTKGLPEPRAEDANLIEATLARLADVFNIGVK